MCWKQKGAEVLRYHGESVSVEASPKAVLGEVGREPSEGNLSCICVILSHSTHFRGILSFLQRQEYQKGREDPAVTPKVGVLQVAGGAGSW